MSYWHQNIILASVAYTSIIRLFSNIDYTNNMTKEINTLIAYFSWVWATTPFRWSLAVILPTALQVISSHIIYKHTHTHTYIYYIYIYIYTYDRRRRVLRCFTCCTMPKVAPYLILKTILL